MLASQEVGRLIAQAAPDCKLLSAGQVYHGDQPFYMTHVLYGGVSAGLFGLVHELRAITVKQVKDPMVEFLKR